MPRQSRGRSSGASRPAAAPANSRGAHTATAPTSNAPSRAPAPASASAPANTESKPPGMMAQMAATAGSIAVGSTIGHGISSMLFGGGGSAEAPPAQTQTQPQTQYQTQQQTTLSCDVQAKVFTKCLEGGDMGSCNFYFEQLKACQAAAAPY